MKPIVIEKLKKIIDISDRLRPKTYLEELAEIDELYEYVFKYHKERFINDEEFRRRIFDLIYKYADKPMIEADVYYLEQMIEYLEYFLEYTKSCRIQNP